METTAFFFRDENQAGSSNHFAELFNRILYIRLPEKAFDATVLDIYATSIDYIAKKLTIH